MLSIIGTVLSVFNKLAGFIMPYFAGKRSARADYAEESLKKSQEKNEIRTDVKRMSRQVEPGLTSALSWSPFLFHMMMS
jgi:hypothetical protein